MSWDVRRNIALLATALAFGCAADGGKGAGGDNSDDNGQVEKPPSAIERYVLGGNPADGALDVIWNNELEQFDFQLRVLVDKTLGPNAYVKLHGEKVQVSGANIAPFKSDDDCSLEFSFVNDAVEIEQQGACKDHAPLGGSFAGHYALGVTPRIENYVLEGDSGVKLEIRWNDELEQIDFALDVFTKAGAEGFIEALAVQVSGANIAPYKADDSCSLEFEFGDRTVDVKQLGFCPGFAGKGASFDGHYVAAGAK